MKTNNLKKINFGYLVSTESEELKFVYNFSDFDEHIGWRPLEE